MLHHSHPLDPAALRLEKVASSAPDAKAAFERLLRVIDDLRVHCPWDKKQTLESLRYLTIEETYELSDAILSKDTDAIKKELGDLMLHIVFYAKIASETDDFDVVDVLNGICEKLIRRHPHVYANVEAKNEQQVKANWERIKLQEKTTDAKQPKSLFEGVPKSMPALVKAMRIQEKARGVGFDWEYAHQVWNKVKEEESELFEHIDTQTALHQVSHQEKAEEEFGDLLFALVNYGRFLGINPENALEKTNRKFIQRFEFMEKEAQKDGMQLENMTLEEMETYWQKAKTNK